MNSVAVTEKFNLIDTPWIPVLWADGRFTRVGIREALTQAGRIRQLASSNPMDRAALLRFLLAVVYWCKGAPENEEVRAEYMRYAREPAADLPPEWKNGFPEEWFAEKLGPPGQPNECFNLLGDGKRFLQYRVAGAKETLLAANYLIQEVPTGSNINLFRHATDDRDGLCPACCAMGLLRLPVFATSAGRGKPPGVNSKPPVYVIPMGESLAETLLLSWQSKPHLGTPAWEDPARTLPATGAVPLLAGLTWVPRRVWLAQPGLPEAACIACGARGPLVRRTVYAPIGSTKTDDDSPEREWSDPHVIYSTLKNSVRMSYHARDALGNADAAADQWQRIFTSLLGSWAEQEAEGASSAGRLPTGYLWAVGFATVQNDKYLEAMEWHFPSLIADDQLGAAQDTVAQWQKGLFKFTGQVKYEAGASSNRKSVEIPALLANIKPQAEQLLAVQLNQLAAAPPEVWKQAAQEAYAPLMAALARALAPGVTVEALARRRKLAVLAPAPQESPPPRQGESRMKIKVKSRKGGPV